MQDRTQKATIVPTPTAAEIEAKKAEVAKLAALPETKKEVEAKKETETEEEKYVEPKAWEKLLHNYAENFDPVRYDRNGFFFDKVQITNADAVKLYPINAVLTPAVGLAAIIAGTALAIGGAIRFAAGSVLEDGKMQEGSVRAAYGARMIGQGALSLTSVFTLVTTPLAVLTQKLTGFDAWKSFTKASGYREVNQENPLKRDSSYEISLLDDDAPQNSQQSVQIIKGNNNVIVSQQKDPATEATTGTVKDGIDIVKKTLNITTASNGNDKPAEKNADDKGTVAAKHISATAALLKQEKPASFTERKTSEPVAKLSRA